MGITVVVGGQYGSEGKGKISHYLTVREHFPLVVRCGGPNAGHTTIDRLGNRHVLRQLPTAVVEPWVNMALCAGSYIDTLVLRKEIEAYSVCPERLTIDPHAVIIQHHHKDAEKPLVESISSTCSGTGAASTQRADRKYNVVFAKDCTSLRHYIGDVAELVYKSNINGGVLIEGTQGFGLSLLHSGNWPFTTGRDTTAASFLSDVGASPLDVDDIVMVIRTYPIRVAGNSGPLDKETTWDAVSRSGSLPPFEELTSVAHRVRRVAKFSADVVRKAVMVNKPTKIVLNHADYLGKEIKCNIDAMNLYLNNLSFDIGAEITHVGMGPDIKDVYDRFALNNMYDTCAMFRKLNSKKGHLNF